MARLRFGAPLFAGASTPEAWIRALKRKGYGAAYAPLEPGAPDSLVEEYRQAARENDIVIAEVGAWCLHPLSADREIARAGIEETARRLAFADRLGALCCVNVSTSRGAVWDGPDARNLTEETFGMVVESIREILRLAAPEKACYALEMMPWMYPTCLEDEGRLLQAVNHPRFRVHYDPCNTVNTVEKFFDNGPMMERFVAALHDKLLSIHVKDVQLMGNMTLHFEERCPGDGGLDHARLLRAVAQYCPDAPLMLEHMASEADYDRGLAYLRSVANRQGLDYVRPMELV